MKKNLLLLTLIVTQFAIAQNRISKNIFFNEDELKSVVSKKQTMHNKSSALRSKESRNGLSSVMSCDTLGTTFMGGNGNAGNMFQVNALHTIKINYFDGNINGNGYMKIYYKAGSFVGSEANAAAWTFIDSVNVTSAGSGIPTMLNIPVNVTINGGDSASFYVTGNNSGASVNYTNGTTQGAVYSSNADLQIQQGIGLGYPFGSTFTPRIWNGIIHYCDSGSVPAPVAQFSAAPIIICPGNNVTFTDKSSLNPTSWSWNFPGGTPSTSTQQNPVVAYNTAGNYSVSLTVTNVNGSNTVTKANYINVIDKINTSPVSENFEASVFPPQNFYTVDDGNDGVIWMRDSVASGFGTGTASVFFDNYDFFVVGTKDAFRTQRMSFQWAVAPKLFFDVAYSPYDTSAAVGESDTLAVYASTDCGTTFSLLYLKGGTQLSADSSLNNTSLFIPTPAQWRTDSVDLSAYIGQTDVIISFENRSYFGNGLYLDNINFSSNTGVSENNHSSEFFISPNPVNNKATITIRNLNSSEKNIALRIFDVFGKEIRTIQLISSSVGDFTAVFDKGNLPSGMYFIHLEGKTYCKNGKIVIE